MKFITLIIAALLPSCAGLGITYSGEYGTASTDTNGAITYTPPTKPIVIGVK